MSFYLGFVVHPPSPVQTGVSGSQGKGMIPLESPHCFLPDRAGQDSLGTRIRDNLPGLLFQLCEWKDALRWVPFARKAATWPAPRCCRTSPG